MTKKRSHNRVVKVRISLGLGLLNFQTIEPSDCGYTAILGSLSTRVICSKYRHCYHDKLITRVKDVINVVNANEATRQTTNYHRLKSHF